MIHWGIIGLGNIALRFMNSLSHHEEGITYAVASLTASKRDCFHEKYPAVKVYQNYDDLLNDPKVDAVYIALRHNDHYQWALKSLHSGKAVLCEKPATLSYQQTKDLCETSKKENVFFMEAMKTRFVPMMEKLKQVDIGTIQRVETSFCYESAYREGHYLYDLDQGGILYDVGSYNIAATLFWIDSPIKSIHTLSEKKYGIDAYDEVELCFENGSTALLQMALDRNLPKKMRVIGSLGFLEAEPFYRPETVKVTFNSKESYTLNAPYIIDDFYTEIQEVHDCMSKGFIESPKMTHQDSLECMKIMEKIKESFDD